MPYYFASFPSFLCFAARVSKISPSERIFSRTTYKHDAAEALLCVVSASVGTMYRPAANLWAVEG